MKVNRQKLEIAMARACMDTRELCEKSGLPRGSLNNLISGKGVRPGTFGRVAKALGIDVTEIIEEEC